ncbi:MAG: ATP-dependent sacrificial sulfur transferase LarE, partial [Candidatus Gastranaerophilales bacterium]|nr:ATP-dependent sacrificial sulfur transferase LarE [Candidatus Gastranaerophilales bacterium]
IKYKVIYINELDIEGFKNNPKNRCYLCKSKLFNEIKKAAAEDNIYNIIEGSNFDDIKDYRPGRKAIKELGILSPLESVKLTKEEIRILSKEKNLKTWNKPSFACLSSRIPYGEEITKEKLKMIENAEQILFDTGFRQCRVRIHGIMARIEIEEKEFEKLIQKDIRTRINKEFTKLGFSYVSLDLKGYRTGSMNEVLK